MSGLITTKHLFTNAADVIRGFGLRTWLRCLRAAISGRPCTFLSMAVGF